jgi:integrase
VEQVANPRHLERRGAVYWYRRKVPKDLRGLLPGKHENSREIRYSLKTKERAEALERLPLEDIKWNARFRAARKIGDKKAEQMVKAWFDEQDRQVARSDATLRDPESIIEAEQAASIEEQALKSGIEELELPLIQAVADQILLEQGWPRANSMVGPISLSTPDIDKTNDDYWALCDEVRGAMIELVKRRQARLKGEPLGTYFDPMYGREGEGRRTAPFEQDITLSELIERFLADPGKGRAGRSVLDLHAAFRPLLETVGPDFRVRDLTREDFRQVQDVLKDLPSNATKRWKGKKLAQVARIAREKGIASMHPRTSNGYLSKISTLMNWALDEGYVDRNQAKGLRVAGPKGSRKDGRDPFTPEQLKAIFEDNTFTDPSRPRNAAFWLPLLGLFTGARLNELCQLKADDVAEYDGVHCLIIRKVDPQDRLKSRAAHRTIPLHPELVRLGFLDHVEQVRKSGGGRLFPDVPLGEDGYYSSIFSKRFSRFLKKSNAKTEKTGFHSLRHNMTMALREGGVPADRIRELMGWTGQGMEETTYGSSLRARTLFEEICKGKYPVDLSHLFSNSGAPSGTTSEDGGDDPLS